MGYRWLAGALMGALGLMGCPRRACVAPLGAARRDSAWASVRVVERWRVDTVWVELAPARDSVAGARDTLSRLENAVAVSYCAVGADGRLSHSLAVKGGAWRRWPRWWWSGCATAWRGGCGWCAWGCRCPGR